MFFHKTVKCHNMSHQSSPQWASYRSAQKKIISYNIKRMKCFKCKSFTNYEILKNKNWNYQERKLSVNSGHKLYLVVFFYPL